MLGIHCRLIIASTILLVAASCNDPNGPQSSTDIQMKQMDRAVASYGSYFTYMKDNALLSDLSLGDIHFIPHTSEISGIGEVRIDRMAKLLNAYGGTVRYGTNLRDETLVEQRMQHVREYLTLVGCSMDRVTVAVAMAGGDGMPADEAVAKYRRGTSQDEDSSSGGSSGSGIMSGGLNSSGR